MTSDALRGLEEVRLDLSQLYREENYTDLKVGSVRKMVPVRPDGSDDPSRTPVFMASTTLMSPAGPLPVSFEIEAATLAEVAEKYPQALRQAVNEMIEEAREYQRDQASRIVVPAGGLPPLGHGGAAPGGGKIQLR